MALAEGTLDATAASAARAEIETCSDCVHDLELQALALTALETAPPAQLSEFESAKLRRDIRGELGVFKEEVTFEPSKRQRRFPIAAFGTAAAVLIAVVAIAPRLSLVGGADSADTVALEAAESTIAAATTAAPRLDAAAGQVQVGEEDNLGTAAPTTSPNALSTTMAPPPEGALERVGYYAANPDLTLLRSRLESQEFDPDSARLFALKDAEAEIAEEDVNTVNSCLVVTLSTSDEFIEGFQFARGNYDGREVIFYVYLAEEPAESAVVVQAADNCEELARAGP